MRGINSLMYMMNYKDPFGMMGAVYGIMVFFCVIAIILGLAQLLWGYKLLRFWITVQGFFTGGAVGGLIAMFVFYRLGSAGIVMGVILTLICAVLGAFLAYMFYKVGVFLQCFSCGYAAAVVLFGILGHYMGLAMVLGVLGGIALGVLGVLFIKPMFIIVTSVTGGLNCGIALGVIFGSPVIGFVLSLGLIGLGLWYQITRNNGLFEAPGKGITGLPSSIQLPPISWRLLMVLICVGIAAAATLIVCAVSKFNIFRDLLWAVAATGAAGYIWRGNFSRERGGDTVDQLMGIAASAVPVFAVCIVLWLPYDMSFYYRYLGTRGLIYGFMVALVRTLLYLIPVLTLGVMWKQSVPSPLLYRPSKEDINRMLMGAAVAGGVMAVVHVVSLLGSMLFLRSHASFGTIVLLIGRLVVDAVTAAAMAYVWGRRGIYKDTAEDRAPAFPVLSGETPAGQPVQTSKFRRKINVGIVKAENSQEYWREGAPLALTQMTLTEQAGQLSLMLGLQNLGQGIINAIYVDIDCYNVLKEKVAQIKDVSFLDLKVGRGNIFFNSIPVRIPEATVRQCEICLRHVVFADGTIWNGDEGQFLEMLEPQKYLAGEDELGPELADEFCRLMAASRGKGLADMKRLYLYAPKQREGYWYCGCGQINPGGEDTCCACGVGRDELFAMTAPELLTRVREDRLKEEQRRIEEDERLKAERIAELNRKIEETKAAARKKAQELVSHGKNCYEKGSEKVQGYVSSIGAAKDSRTAPGAGADQTTPENPMPQPVPEPSAPQPAPGAPAPQPAPEAPAPQPAPEAPAPQPVPGASAPQPASAPAEQATSKRPCPSCGAMCGAAAQFCMNCGASLKQETPQNKICPGCGRKNEATAKFCTVCGTKLGE